MSKKIIKLLSNHFVISEEEFIKYFIIKKIKETNIKILYLQKKYKIKNTLEFENLYKTNKIPEKELGKIFKI